MKVSSGANLLVGRVHLDAGRYAVALKYFNVAAQLDKKAPGPYVMMASLHRKQSRFAAALKAADQAVNLDREDSEAHYQRACALARLGRLKDAMSALEKSIELDEKQMDYIADEADLKQLSALSAFKNSSRRHPRSLRTFAPGVGVLLSSHAPLAFSEQTQSLSEWLDRR